MLTFLFQPTSYWTGAYESYEEISPLGAAILRIHPAAFAAFVLAWMAAVLVIVGVLREPWNRMIALAVVVGHAAGIYGWLDERSTWSTISVFLTVGAITVLCWRQAEARSPQSPARGAGPVKVDESDRRRVHFTNAPDNSLATPPSARG
jgi:hypothetical protein